MITTYTDGQVATITGTFTETSNGEVVDPGTVQFLYCIASSASAAASTITLTYTSATQPAVGVVARLSAGVYEVQLDTTALPGYWTCEWVSTGAGQTVSTPPVCFNVIPRAL